MPGMAGVDAVRELRARHPELVIIVMTGFDEEEMLRAAHEAGAEAAMRKHRLLNDVGERLRSIGIAGRDQVRTPRLFIERRLSATRGVLAVGGVSDTAVVVD